MVRIILYLSNLISMRKLLAAHICRLALPRVWILISELSIFCLFKCEAFLVADEDSIKDQDHGTDKEVTTGKKFITGSSGIVCLWNFIIFKIFCVFWHKSDAIYIDFGSILRQQPIAVGWSREVWLKTSIILQWNKHFFVCLRLLRR